MKKKLLIITIALLASLGYVAVSHAYIFNPGSGGGSTTSTVTINGSQASPFSIKGDGTTVTSTISGATTIFSAIGGGGGFSNPQTCSKNSSSGICLTLAPYYASGQGATTATTTGTFGIGTSGTISSCSTFLANEGVLIAGAGASSTNYIGTIVSCSGTTLTVTPATSHSVSNATVQHDDTAAFNNAIAAISTTTINNGGGGTIWVPDGTYLVNGPLQNATGSNAIIPMPTIANYSSYTPTIAIKGMTPIGMNGPLNQAGAIIETSAPTGNVFGGYDAATGGGFPGITNVWLDIENLTLVGPTNPGIVMINASTLQALTAKNLIIEAGGFPTNASSGAIFYPELGNSVRIMVENIAEGGFWTAFKLGEHSYSTGLYVANSVNGFLLDPGANPGGGPQYNGNSVSIDYAWCQQCTNTVAAGTAISTVNIQNLDSEIPYSYAIYDPNSVIRGIININDPFTDNGGPCSEPISGATKVAITWLQCAGISSSTGGTPSLSSGLIENWFAQEGQGAKFANSGYDYTNYAVASSVTWGTTTGFTGSVAHFNGSNSVAIPVSATSTAFDGSLPFSGCLWVNLSSSDAVLLSNFILTPTVTGYSFRTISGQLEFYLANNFGSGNYIYVVGPTGALTTGSLHLACFTYGGSEQASSVSLYLDGSFQARSVQIDALSGSTVSPNPLRIGEEIDSSSPANGAIGRVKIWNRLLSATEISQMYNAGPNGL